MTVFQLQNIGISNLRTVKVKSQTIIVRESPRSCLFLGRRDYGILGITKAMKEMVDPFSLLLQKNLMHISSHFVIVLVVFINFTLWFFWSPILLCFLVLGLSSSVMLIPLFGLAVLGLVFLVSFGWDCGLIIALVIKFFCALTNCDAKGCLLLGFSHYSGNVTMAYVTEFVLFISFGNLCNPHSTYYH